MIDTTHPTHLTMAQAARALGLSYQSIQKRVMRGTLQLVPWYGTDMVPWPAIAAEVLERRGAGLAPQEADHA